MTDARQDDGAVVESSNTPAYESIEIPAKSPTEYTYAERRAELLQLVRQRGHPSALNQAELAERYEVSQQQISKDLDRLEEHIRASIGRRRDLTATSVYDRAIQGLLEAGEFYKAALVEDMRQTYLSDREYELDVQERIETIREIQERSKYR